MNKYDEKYDIRLGKTEDIPRIMQFIDEHWKKDHILARDREMFEYEFVDGDEVHVVIAVDRTTNTIQAMLGFLYSSKTAGKRDSWGSMWKAINGNGNIPFLGVELSKRVPELAEMRYRIGTGSNPKTSVPLNKLMFEREIVKLKHYYFLNRNKETYTIAIIKDKGNPILETSKEQISFVKLERMEEFKNFIEVERIEAIPYKDNWYIQHRYYSHPRYQYKIFGLYDANERKAVIVGREITVNNSRVLRIVDYIGDQTILQDAGAVLEEWVKEYEYIDFFEYGFCDDYLKKAGFIDREETENVIPNYFEPFVQSNVDIWGFKTHEGTTICKADGDQDRPNL